MECSELSAERLQARGIKNILVTRRGTTLFEWHEGGTDRPNYVFSCSKSVLSALIGILITEKQIASLDDDLGKYVPHAYGQKVTIRHLLSMSSGIDWRPMVKGNFDYNRMIKSGEWVSYVLDKRIDPDLYGRFNYCDGNSLLLSAVITGVTGESAHEFAKKTLFRYLDTGATSWKEQNGITLGCTGLHISLGGLSKIGELWLKGGSFGGKQIVSDEYVSDSVRTHSAGHPEWFGSYGYHWWVSDREHNSVIDMYFALGAHGQFLFVVPELEVIAAFRKKPGRRSEMMYPRTILFELIKRLR